MSEHTPAPWTVTDNSWETSSIYGADGSIVAECPISADVDEDTQEHFEAIKEANARLASAAPELLAAAMAQEELVNFVGDDARPEIRRVQQMRWAAIIKARGL